MRRSEVDRIVREVITQVANEQDVEIPPLEEHLAVVDDLGFSSLDVATLTSLLEDRFGVDPFRENLAVITEVRTVADVIDLYERCAKQPKL
jgi:acyl carrier protein